MTGKSLSIWFIIIVAASNGPLEELLTKVAKGDLDRAPSPVTTSGIVRIVPSFGMRSIAFFSSRAAPGEYTW